jgi:uncharacterized protein YdhG (YjbR/CyaY superfamily)
LASDPRVDAYLAGLPAAQQAELRKLRNRVRELVPDAIETISYGMPAFRVDGRFFLSYAAWTRHCSIYPIDDAILARHAGAIGGYGRTKGALHFSATQPLPDALLRDLVEQRANHLRGGSGY